MNTAPAVAPWPTERILGIDPGAHGALALIELGRGYGFLACADMPIRDRGKSVTNNVLDGRILGRIIAEWAPTVVIVEDVQPMPSRGRAEGEAEGPAEREPMPARSAYTFGGFCLGAVAACEALGFDVFMVRPTAWKRAAGLGRVGERSRSEVKAESLALARGIWPDAPLSLARHENRAEALLLARFGFSTQARLL